MKKQFLTLALLATVAGGGAFAGNSARVPRPGAPFNASDPCGAPLRTCSDMGDPCTIEIGPEFIRLYGNTSIAPGTCTVALYEFND